MKDFKINVSKGRLKKKISELDIEELQETIKGKVDVDLEAITILSEEEEITGVILHRKDGSEPRLDLQAILDLVEDQVNPYESTSDVLQKSKTGSMAERLDAMERILSKFPDLKIKKEGGKNERKDIL